ncbi:MAG: lysine--tRNA ligase, partial [Deltaproteobacteria bacterium]|nr:lysine--tRNA ligase [Deltaproteobacteria bacterium]
MDKKSDIIEQRKQKLLDLKRNNTNPYPNDFVVLHTVSDIKKAVEDAPDSLSEDRPVFVVAGRMMAINRFGKASFIRFRDRTGQLQAYVRKDKIGEKSYNLFKQLDIGDFVGLTGGMFKTRTGEWTLLVKEFKLACKSVRPLPEKFHGLKDPEKRYRRRYIDLAMNSDVRDIF